MPKEFIDLLREKITGEHLFNRQNSNRNGEVYEIMDIIPGIFHCIKVQYKDGVEDNFSFQEIRGDESIPIPCLVQLVEGGNPVEACLYTPK